MLPLAKTASLPRSVQPQWPTLQGGSIVSDYLTNLDIVSLTSSSNLSAFLMFCVWRMFGFWHRWFFFCPSATVAKYPSPSNPCNYSLPRACRFVFTDRILWGLLLLLAFVFHPPHTYLLFATKLLDLACSGFGIGNWKLLIFSSFTASTTARYIAQDQTDGEWEKDS